MNRYDEVARRLGLHTTPETTTIFTQVTTLDGSLEGHSVWVQRIHGANTLVTRVMLRAPGSVAFELGPEVWTTKLAHLVGKHDVSIGEPEFDKKYRIETKDVAGLKRLLIPGVRALLDELHAAGWRFVLSDKSVELISLPGSPMDDSADAIENQIRQTIAVARRFSEALPV